jgi:hypothetical protein
MTRALLLFLLLLSCSGVGATEFGVYRWEAPAGPANVDAFEVWLGKPVQLAEAFEPRDTWDNIDGAAWQLSAWSQWVRAKAGRNLILSVPMLPSTGGVSLAGCAAGQYDVYWRNLANDLAYYGLHWTYLRLGWEMDGSWYAWGAAQGSGLEASFAGCFRRIVTTMRATQPASQWKFVWNPTATWTDPAWLGAAWPGDAYVDVVGIDLYDQSWAPNTYPYPATCDSACRLARQQTAWNGYAWYLQTIRDFAVAHGKPLAIPEWGIVARSDGHGGGDNPYYIQKMYEFLSDPGNYVQFSSLFDFNAPEANYELSGLDGTLAFPQAAAKFRQLFGAATPAPAPVPAPAPAPGDVTPPTVFLSVPAAGSLIARRSTITMEASATDNVGVAAVEFSVNGRLACRVVASPFRCTASVGNKNESAYTITSRAVDAAGNAASYSRTYGAAR